MVVLGNLKHFIICSHLKCKYYSATPDCPLPTAHSRLPRCAFRRRIKFATGRTAPDSLGALDP
ncbi:hypothetical protein [Moorena bouillonii]|uniref:hypothetical protein n=1 Tax=Moorena bouillonii TaxID=207920 RepID=UPI00117D38AB|nr:hypothetical protein [Moorena bouillonii]